jgi:hypothetical protein
MLRKIEARWWVVHERLGAGRGILDLSLQFVVQASRWLAKAALRRDTQIHSTWLRVAIKAARAGTPPAPTRLPDG